MTNYHVVPHKDGWKIIGTREQDIYKTKKSAVQAAKHIARTDDRPLIIHSKDGKVTSVILNTNGTKILSANVKHKLNNKKVRNTIAEVMSERKGIVSAR